MLLASKFDHCLADLIYRWRIGELAMDVVAVVSNHPRDTYAHLGFGDVPFHHLPVSRQTKLEQETQLWGLIRESGAELVVLLGGLLVVALGIIDHRWAANELHGRVVTGRHPILIGSARLGPPVRRDVRVVTDHREPHFRGRLQVRPHGIRPGQVD